MRFVEPATGDVVALRPDWTPQIARIAATRFARCAVPLRFMYEGSVLRTPRGRSRRLRQLSQAGVELLGWASVDADVEVIRVALDALDALGLHDVRVELSHATVARALVEQCPEALRELFIDALATRDRSTLSKLLGPSAELERVRAACDFAGPASLLDATPPAALSTEPIATAIEELRAVSSRLSAAGIEDRVLVDLGEVRGLGYYTGVSFVLLVPEVGEPVGAGGRYDALLARYGAPGPATGCAIDLELVDEALGSKTSAVERARRVLLAGESEARSRAAQALRARGYAVAECEHAQLERASDEELRAFAHALVCRDGVVLERGDSSGRDWLTSAAPSPYASSQRPPSDER